MHAVKEAASTGTQAGQPAFQSRPLSFRLGAEVSGLDLRRSDEMSQATIDALWRLLCERGIRGFDPSTRNLVDLTAVALLANVHRLPVIVDPSHGSGRRDLVLPLSRAAIAAGAAGVMIETHDDPGRALSDGPQALRGEELAVVARELLGAPRP